MSKQVFYILGILATILTGAFLYPKFCCQDCHKIPIPPIQSKVTKGMNNHFNLSSSEFNYTCSGNFNFSLNSFNYIKPIDNCVNDGIDKLKAYFDKNPNGRLLITGYALKTEKNTSAFPNLGFARANDIKNYFISKGIPSNRFDINGELKDIWDLDSDTLLGPLNYTITNNQTSAKAQDWDAIKEEMNADPLILYFNTNQSEINLNKEERLRITELARYLDNVPDAKINSVGHTDGTGDRNVNIQLGLERAEFAKDYLAKNGINGNRIESSSKGPDEPIADNLTPEGKAKNRRTEITLK